RLKGALLAERLAKPAQMLRQQFFELGCLKMLGMLKHHPQDIGIRTVSMDCRRYAKGFDLAQIELPFLSQEPAIQAVALLCAPLCPGPTHSGHAQRDRRARAPNDLKPRFDLAREIHQP